MTENMTFEPMEIAKKSKIQFIVFQLKKIALLILLFVSLFAASYYVVNLLDIKPEANKSVIKEANAADIKAGDENLKSKLGQSDVSLAGFSDWANANSLVGGNVYEADTDGDGLPNYLEYVHGTDPNNQDTDGDKFTDMQEIRNGYDPDASGDIMTKVSVKIDKLDVSAPMVWSKTDNDQEMLKELENGIAHFLGSASPGQKGNAIISGHSSNYIWARGSYNYVFKKLNDLENGDTVTIATFQRNGRIITYKYQIKDKYVTTPDDERIFEETSKPTLTLSTCWPIGTNLKRVIVKAEII